MHFRTRPTTVFALLVGSSFLLSACGNRGPLTLPPKDQPAKAAMAPTSVPDHSKTASPAIPGKS